MQGLLLYLGQPSIAGVTYKACALSLVLIHKPLELEVSRRLKHVNLYLLKKKKQSPVVMF